ncbi:MAG TPA: hypothetical protein VGJ60_27790 [Chloroflexota bacterium]
MAASLPTAPPLEHIEASSIAGFDGVGLRLYKSPAFPNWQSWLDDAPPKRDVKRALMASGQEMNEILSYYLLPDTDLDDMAASLEYGAALGATYALVLGRDPEWNRQRDNFGKFCELAARFDLTAALGAPIGSVSPTSNALKILDECGRSNAVTCIGVGPFLRADTPEALRGHNRRLLPIVHLNNGTPEQAVSELLDALNVNVTLSLEWPAPRGSHYTSVEWAKRAMAGTRQFLHAYHDARSSSTLE